jgi:hypothetical protein
VRRQARPTPLANTAAPANLKFSLQAPTRWQQNQHEYQTSHKIPQLPCLCPADSPPQQQQSNASDDAAARKYLSLLPPFFSRPTRLEQFGPGLWGLTQPLKLEPISSFDIQLRMTAARLPDGSLLLVSPVAPTAEMLAQLAGLGGRVAHIVLPSSSPEHW